MKLLKENKSLGILLVVSVIYIGITFLFINPLRIKNNDLEKQKLEILTSEQQINDIQKSSKKQGEDIVLLIENNIGDLVDINSINKQDQQIESGNGIILEVNFYSSLNEFFKLDKELKKLNLDKSIENIKVERIQNENTKKSKVSCTITFKVVLNLII